MRFGMKIRIGEIVKGVWAFCSYLFVPQRGRRTQRGNPVHGNFDGETAEHRRKENPSREAEGTILLLTGRRNNDG